MRGLLFAAGAAQRGPGAVAPAAVGGCGGPSGRARRGIAPASRGTGSGVLVGSPVTPLPLGPEPAAGRQSPSPTERGVTENARPRSFNSHHDGKGPPW